MHNVRFVVPLLAVACLSIACTNPDPEPEGNAELRVSASVQADIAGLAGVSLEFTPGLDCFPAGKPASDGTPYDYGIDVTQMLYPDGTPWNAATDYTHLFGEAAFVSVVPGCYDVVAAPLGADGEPLSSCLSSTVPVVVDEYASLILDIPLQCGEVPRLDLDITAHGNFAPNLLSLTADPMTSACDVTLVCATARDADNDMLEFEWPQPEGLLAAAGTAPWPTIAKHTFNADRSVTQCIAVQARDSGSYEIGVNVYDLYTPTRGLRPIRIEDRTGVESHASGTVTLDATLGCEATGRSAVIVLTLDNKPGMPQAAASTLIDNTLRWIHGDAAEGPSVLVVLDDNHHGEDIHDGRYVAELVAALGYHVEYVRESPHGLDYNTLLDYDIVWFVNPGHEMDDPISHTALLRYRASGGGLVLQGDDIARFKGNPSFMEPLTYLEWHGNGTTACGMKTDNNKGASYTVTFEIPSSQPHPMAAGLEQLSFQYGNDIDHTVPLGKGERVLAWATLATQRCEVRTPVVVALEPDELLAWAD